MHVLLLFMSQNACEGLDAHLRVYKRMREWVLSRGVDHIIPFVHLLVIVARKNVSFFYDHRCIYLCRLSSIAECNTDNLTLLFVIIYSFGDLLLLARACIMRARVLRRQFWRKKSHPKCSTFGI